MREYQVQMAHSFICLNVAFSNSLTKLPPLLPLPTPYQAHFSLCTYDLPTHHTMCLFIMPLVFLPGRMVRVPCQGFLNKLCRTVSQEPRTVTGTSQAYVGTDEEEVNEHVDK